MSIEQVREAETPEEMRLELQRMRRYDALCQRVMDAADIHRMSEADRYTLLAYYALRDRQSGMARELSAAANAPPARHDGATADYWLRELLAVVHRDGGHYAAKYGLAQATEDAIEKLNTPPNAALSGRWPTSSQETSKPVPSVRSNA
jgi:hypothetical protein